MFGPSGILLNFGDLLQRYILDGMTELLQVLGKGQTHHVRQCDIYVITLRAEELGKQEADERVLKVRRFLTGTRRVSLPCREPIHQLSYRTSPIPSLLSSIPNFLCHSRFIF